MSFINQGKAGFIFGNVFVRGAKTGRPAFKDMSQTRGYPGWVEPEVPAVFHAATYDPITFELQQESVGVGGETCTHTAEIYAPDYLGVYYAFGANEPVWEGMRVSINRMRDSEDLDLWNGLDRSDVIVTEVTGSVAPPNILPSNTRVWKVVGTDATVWRIGQHSARMNGFVVDEVACLSWYVKSAITSTPQTFRLMDGITTPNLTANDTWQRFSAHKYDKADQRAITADSSSNAAELYICAPAYTTSQETDLNIPSEYLVTGGEGTSPPQKYFANSNGNTVTDNVVTEAVSTTLLDPLPMLKYQPAATNIQIYSNDAQNASYWQGLAGGNQPTKDQVGLDGLPNNACLFTGDGSAAAYIKPTSNTTIPADTNPTTFVYWIKKDPLATNELYGKSNIAGLSYLRLYISPATGVLGAGSTGVNKIIDVGGWWKCMQQNTNEGAGTTAGIQFYPQATGGFTVGNFEIHNNKTIEQVQDLGPIFTAGTAVSTDEIINTWAAANHSDAGDSYEADYKLSGEDQVLLSMGGTPVLEVKVVAELVTNGDFVTDSDWTKGSGWLIDNGVAYRTTPGAGEYIYQLEVAEIGDVLEIEVVVNSISGGILNVFHGAAGSPNMEITTAGIHSYVTTGGISNNVLWLRSLTGCICEIESVSVKAPTEGLRLTDGTNSCSTPIVSAEPHIIATYNATDGMTLDVDGVTATCPYDGTLGAGDLSTKATLRDLIRRES